MKSNDEKVPGFDDIIFENRNKSYGAYYIRKRYNSTTILSALGVVTLSAVTIILISASAPDHVAAKSEPGIVVVVQPDNLIDPNKITAPVPQKPVVAAPQYRYIEPDIVDDTVNIDQVMMPMEFAANLVKDGDITSIVDTVVYAEVYDRPEDPEPFTFVQEPPEYPGGNAALLKFIAENTRYPEEAIENNIQGKVFVKFAVAADGSVTRIQIMRGVHPLLDKEAERVVSTLPLWKPGRQNGRPVPVWFNVPVNFHVVYY